MGLEQYRILGIAVCIFCMVVLAVIHYILEKDDRR